MKNLFEKIALIDIKALDTPAKQNKFIRALTQITTANLHTYANFNDNSHSNHFLSHNDAICQGILQTKFLLKLIDYFLDFYRRFQFLNRFKMGSEPKRIKLEEKSSPTANETQFLNLNDDCIFEIFDRLLTIDWYSMSLTCERLQKLALDHFQRKFPDEAITIQSKAVKGEISYIFSGTNGHPVKLIPNVKIVNVQRSKRLFEFIRAECCPKLKTLSITTNDSISTINGGRIKSQLKELESLAIFKLNSKTDIYNVFLKHCPKLEHLTIETMNDWKANWMLYSYPQLKSLSFLVDCRKPYREQFGQLAGQFFRNNPGVKDISCIGGWSLNPILLNVSKIESLAIEIKTYDNLAEILGSLKNYCQRSPIECLEFDMTNLRLPVEALKMLNDFNQIYPIHGLSGTFDNDEILTREITLNILGLKQLKDLDIIVMSGWLEFSDLFGDVAHLLAMGLVHLEELKIYCQYYEKKFVLEEFMAPFIRFALKMKKLTLSSNFHPWWFRFSQDDFIKLKADRLLLTGACSMEICIAPREGFLQKFNIPSKVAK